MKPHITKTLDGSRWVCYCGEIPGHFQKGYGKTPMEAYENFLKDI